MDGKPKIIALMAALAALVPAAACAKGGGQNGGQDGTTSPSAGANTGGGMTLAQFEARRGAKLMAADSDGDGRISRAEFIAAFQGKGDPAARFDRMDTNHDGYLDKGEIDAMLARRFRRMDTNGDGVVSRDERAAAHRKGDQPNAGGQPGPAGAGDGNE